MTINELMDRNRDDEKRIPTWTLGDRLRKSLEDSGIPVGMVAEAFDVNRATVGRWLHDKQKPSSTVLWMWAAVTGVDLEWLTTGQPSAEALSGSRPVTVQYLDPHNGRPRCVKTSLTVNRRTASRGAGHLVAVA